MDIEYIYIYIKSKIFFKLKINLTTNIVDAKVPLFSFNVPSANSYEYFLKKQIFNKFPPIFIINLQQS